MIKNKKNIIKYSLIILSAILLFTAFKADWGFFGHRRINRLAVFTLPPDMFPLYKNQIEYLTDHAVDPDKRRYATKHEAVRHYIDIDHWGKPPFTHIPRQWDQMLMQFTTLHLVNNRQDTIHVGLKNWSEPWVDSTRTRSKINLSHTEIESIKPIYQVFYRKHILPQYYEDDWIIEPNLLPPSLLELAGVDLQQINEVTATDEFSGYGILPYHLEAMQARLTRAFESANVERILRMSAEFGHYIGDAHVPLHTTENYNGQMTGQIGIHAFWESRIPELIADKEFDYFVGKAEYIDDPKAYYWDVVLKSHSLVDSVLIIERRLSKQYPIDQQYCYEERLERTIRTQCEAYALAYDEAMRGMVEDRMRAAILSIGSAWLTAWVDAGQPNLKKMMAGEGVVIEKDENLEKAFERGASKGREHGS